MVEKCLEIAELMLRRSFFFGCLGVFDCVFGFWRLFWGFRVKGFCGFGGCLRV